MARRRVMRIIYTFVDDFPMITTEYLHFFTYLYQRLWVNFNTFFDWEGSRPLADDVTEAIAEMNRNRCLYPHRDPEGNPLHMRWTIRERAQCGNRDPGIDRDMLVILRYYFEEGRRGALISFLQLLRLTSKSKGSAGRDVALAKNEERRNASLTGRLHTEPIIDTEEQEIFGVK